MKECQNCKNEVSDNDLYCNICGTKIEKIKNNVGMEGIIEEEDKGLSRFRPHFYQQFGFMSALSILGLFLFGCYGLMQIINGNAEEGASIYVILIFIINFTIVIYKLNQYLKKLTQYHKSINNLEIHNRKKKKYGFIVIVSLTLVISFFVGINIHQENMVKKRIVNRFNVIGNELGLQDIKVTITEKDSEYDWYNVIIDSSNFDSFSPADMMMIDNKMKIDNAIINLYTSNGNKYKVYPSTLSVYKNGEEIYDDYNNSESHKAALENKSKTNSIETTVNDDAELATCWSLAIDVVKAKLKSPSSAKFPFSYADEDVIITKSVDTYTVKSWVDAENSFGAKIRSNFIVKMTKSGTGKKSKFTAESCVID